MEENRVAKKRIEYLDIAKGIGIISVIIGHYDYRPMLQNFIFSFHMPIFFLISGYFYKNVPWNDFFRKKARQLIVPYIITSIGVIISSMIWDFYFNFYNMKYNVLRWISAALYGSGNTYDTPYYIPQIGAIWFLLALFISVIILKFVSTHRYVLFEITIVALLGYYSSKLLWLPFSIQAGMVAVIYVYVGYYLKSHKVPRTKLWIEIALSAIIWAIYLVKGGGHLYLVGNYFQYGLFDILVSFCACYVIVSISKFLNKVPILNKAFIFIGGNSLIILCFHLIEQNTFRWDIIGAFIEKSGLSTFYVILLLKILWAISGVYLVRLANCLIKRLILRFKIGF